MKPLFIISCPIDTYSGYGARSRDVVKAIIELDKYDVKVLPQRWGTTPWGFINDHPEWHFLAPHLLPTGNNIPSKPKIWAQISVPNEFQPMGDFNIGFTAGIETTICAPQWIEGLNRMDLNIVSSNHAKTVFENSKFTQQDEQGNVLGEVSLTKPIEVLFEGADLTKYFPSKETNKLDLKHIKENFAFLATGHWMAGDMGEDRKNIGLLVKAFYETFKNQKKAPSLILKTSGAGASYMDRDYILNKLYTIKQSIKADTLPNIYFLHGELSDEEMNDLYNHKKVKALVSLTKGEGFGRPLLEFSLTKKPIITTNWSGHTDFLDPKFTTLIEGELKNVHKSAAVKDMILEESHWFSPNTLEVSNHLHSIFNDYKTYEKGALLQYHKSKNNFSFNKMKDLLSKQLETHTPEFVEEVKLNLPKLNLPKLKRLENV
tara:strand:- start:479 stop:1771 length:1293 start_codon:yes stop_codon:yes gene_type:complete